MRSASFVYDDDAPDGKYVDPLADNDASDSEYVDSSVDSDVYDNNEGVEVSEPEPLDPRLATGNDWITLSYDEKFSLVSEILSSMTRSGNIKISADENWFIDALDAYWSDSPTSDKVLDMMTLSGVADGVIES